MCADNPYSIKAVFFDFGDTLATLSPPKEELFVQAARSIGLELDAEEVRRAYHIVDFGNKYSSVKINSQEGRDAFYKDYNRYLCNALGISSCFERLHPFLVYHFEAMKQWQIIKGINHVLEKLRCMNIRLAVVANWNRNLAMLMNELGLSKFFDSIISSEEAGVEKPSPEILYYALNQLNLYKERSNVIYIGNEYETDVICARSAGVVPVLIDRNNFYLHADCIRFNSVKQWFESVNFG